MDQISEKKLVGVHPDLVKVVRRAHELNGFPFRVTCGLRTVSEQKQLVAIGASRTMRSRHLTGHAVDLAALVDVDKDGRIETEEMFHWPLFPIMAKAMKQAAKELGVDLEWGGDWTTFKDGPHFQLTWKSYP